MKGNDNLMNNIELEETLLNKVNIFITSEGRKYLKKNANEELLSYLKENEYAINCYEVELVILLNLFKNDIKNLNKYIEKSDYHNEKSLCGSGGCVSCPFSCTGISESIQNYGCLPDSSDIIRMKRESGHNWGCHGDETKICGGYAQHIKENGLEKELNIFEGGIISYNDWYLLGEEEALRKAELKYQSEVNIYANK